MNTMGLFGAGPHIHSYRPALLLLPCCCPIRLATSSLDVPDVFNAALAAHAVIHYPLSAWKVDGHCFLFWILLTTRCCAGWSRTLLPRLTLTLTDALRTHLPLAFACDNKLLRRVPTEPTRAMPAWPGNQQEKERERVEISTGFFL